MNDLSEILLHWYASHGRELPWRGSRDPYLIWVSEIILQQTRVAQGEAYFLRFVARFPDVQTLAAASEDEVMKHWQGLGYYSRARNLHAAARSMAASGFPTTYDGVRALSGVGEYSAAAICSLAYGMPYAVVDGNVYRVLSRYYGIDTPIDSTRGKKLFKELAQQLLDKKRPATYNQAIMDFGALQCTPQSPDCLACPLADSCRALAEGTVQRLPVKGRKAKTSTRYFNYLYVRAGAYTFIYKRTAHDIWRNLYEFPLVEADRDLTEAELTSSPQFRAMIAEGEQPTVRCLLRGVKHVLTHRTILANFYEVTLTAQTASFSAYQRIPADELERYAVPRLVSLFIDSL